MNSNMKKKSLVVIGKDCDHEFFYNHKIRSKIKKKLGKKKAKVFDDLEDGGLFLIAEKGEEDYKLLFNEGKERGVEFGSFDEIFKCIETEVNFEISYMRKDGEWKD